VREIREGRRIVFPSPSAAFRFLGGFHDERAMAQRKERTALIPAKSAALELLELVNRDLVAEVERRSPLRSSQHVYMCRPRPCTDSR
jgi:hypothetical protein